MSTTKTYIAITEIRRNGARIQPDEPLSLTEAEAAQLLECGALREATPAEQAYVTGTPEPIQGGAGDDNGETEPMTRKDRIKAAVLALVARGEVGEDGKPVCALVAEEAGYSRVEGRERDEAFFAVTTTED